MIALNTYLYIAASLAFLALFALVAVLGERKISAYIQDRLGPMEVGPWGSLQTIADIIKLLLKENIVPRDADRGLFNLAPIIVFAAVFAGFAVLPIAPGIIGSGLYVGVLYATAIVSIDAIGLLMAGWSANNKYSLLGAVRAVAQIVAYEVPAGLALLAAVLMYGTLHLDVISYQQGALAREPIYFLGLWDVAGIGGVLGWGALRYPHLLVGLVVFFVAGLAECNRAPFDIPEAESELVAGYHTEYTGFRFSVLFLAEYANMLLISAIAAVLFLGGWNTPLPNLTVLPQGVTPASLSIGELFSRLQFAHLTQGTPGTWPALLWGALWLLLKALGLVFVMIWVRWTYPRLRSDQLMRLCWQYLVPIAIGLCAISAAWKLGEVYLHLG